MHGVVWHRIPTLPYHLGTSGISTVQHEKAQNIFCVIAKNFHDYINQRKQISLIELIIIILGAVKVYTIKILRPVDHNNPKYT